MNSIHEAPTPGSPEHHSRAEQSRINGAKSSGPITPEGKEKTSWNRLKHGFRSHRDVIHGECRETYEKLSEIYFRFFTPENIIEKDNLQIAISARWRARRANMLESCAWNLSMHFNAPDWQDHFSMLGVEYRHTLGFCGALKGNPYGLDIEAINRWEDRCNRRWRAAVNHLYRLRGKLRPLPTFDDLLMAELALPNNRGVFDHPDDDVPEYIPTFNPPTLYDSTPVDPFPQYPFPDTPTPPPPPTPEPLETKEKTPEPPTPPAPTATPVSTPKTPVNTSDPEGRIPVFLTPDTWRQIQEMINNPAAVHLLRG